MTERDQHDSAFKGIMELILSGDCVRTMTGPEVAKFPLSVDFITERICPVPDNLGTVARLINNLPRFIIYEFKGPTDPMQESHIWRLISYCGLFAMEKNLAFFQSEIAAMMIYVGASDKIRRTVSSCTEEFIPGVMEYKPTDQAGGMRLLFMDVDQLPLSPDNLPFLLFREADIEEILEMILLNPDTKRLYGYPLYKIQRKKIQKILRKKGIDVTEVATLKELLEDFGVEAVIDEIGFEKVIEYIQSLIDNRTLTDKEKAQMMKFLGDLQKKLQSS